MGEGGARTEGVGAVVGRCRKRQSCGAAQRRARGLGCGAQQAAHAPGERLVARYVRADALQQRLHRRAPPVGRAPPIGSAVCACPLARVLPSRPSLASFPPPCRTSCLASNAETLLCHVFHVPNETRVFVNSILPTDIIYTCPGVDPFRLTRFLPRSASRQPMHRRLTVASSCRPLLLRTPNTICTRRHQHQTPCLKESHKPQKSCSPPQKPSRTPRQSPRRPTCSRRTTISRISNRKVRFPLSPLPLHPPRLEHAVVTFDPPFCVTAESSTPEC